MYYGDASTSGNHLARRIGSVCGEPRDRNRWNVYCRVPLQLFLLRKAIELLHTSVR